ncbi:MAG: hypothetical protein H7099_05785 [Gemmatimonadaceae bacterium]|nr:hypothetical protein [Gemmatimonadaceae bacterium]
MSAPESRRIGDLDMADPEGEWRAQRAVSLGVTAIVISAAVGLFGDGIGTARNAKLHDGSIATFSRVLRLTNEFDVLLRSVPSVSGRCQVAVDSFSDWYDIVRIAPTTALPGNTSSNGPVTSALPGSTCTIRLTMRARSAGRHAMNVRDTRGSANALEFTVLP